MGAPLFQPRTAFEDRSSALSERETFLVVQAFARGIGRPFTTEEATAVVEWAEAARVGEMCLDLVLRGEVLLRLDERGMVDPIAAT
jgi:hypothetical protein